MLLPIIRAAAFLFFVLDTHYPALASAPGAFLLGVPVSTLLANGWRQVVPMLCGSAEFRAKRKRELRQ